MKKIRKWSLLMIIISTVPKVLFFENNWPVYCIPILWICRQLKRQLRIRSEIFILLEIILNAFNVWQYHHFSLDPLWICYAARCVHFTVPSGRRGALFFLWEQMYTSRSTFIKKIKPFVCHYITMPQQYLKKRLHDKLLHHW